MLVFHFDCFFDIKLHAFFKFIRQFVLNDGVKVFVSEARPDVSFLALCHDDIGQVKSTVFVGGLKGFGKVWLLLVTGPDGEDHGE